MGTVRQAWRRPCPTCSATWTARWRFCPQDGATLADPAPGVANERARVAYAMRQDGQTYAQIAAALGGVSRERARQLVIRGERDERRRRQRGMEDTLLGVVAEGFEEVR